MEIGLGVDAGAGLTFAEHRDVARMAARRGYQSCWTPSDVGQDAFQVCAQWWGASGDVLPGGLATGISVVPVPLWTAPALATAAATLGELTAGRFTLGVGSGSIHNPAYRHTFGLPDWAPLPLMRDYLHTVRALLAGERVEYEGPVVRLHGVSLGRRSPTVPVVLGALGPRMLRLAGEAADGAALNWCTPEQIAWSRDQVAAGAARAGRDPARGAHRRVHPRLRGRGRDHRAAGLHTCHLGLRAGAAGRIQGARLPRPLRTHGLRRGPVRPRGAARPWRIAGRAD